ncbi:MAG: ATP-dependent DNA helicase [Gammaproteobacteria bacterium]|nr:ATP-dependent DNA helicase [Gammaproteobacteria bacterium]MDH5800153.1 ATP-dependent DNA helicase [Gammaproteobacteria bacterium]
MVSVHDLLGSQGPFANCQSDFAARPAQQEMAQLINEILETHGTLVAEAGTGTGKTFAYLVPALLKAQSGEYKVIISTGTRNLQDQLYYRDLPLVKKALGVGVKTALLKGRANYLCHYRYDQQQRQGRLSLQQLQDFKAISQWLPRTVRGDIAEVSGVPEDAAVWPLVTSNVDNCLGSDCPNLSDCFVAKARRSAQDADLVVVNHHLFFADMALRDEGFGEVLPGANAFIFDEAHHLPETASRFFGSNVSGRQLLELTKDTRAEMLEEAADVAEIHDICDAVDKSVKDLRLSLGDVGQRIAWTQKQNEEVQECFEQLLFHCEALEDCLKEASVRSGGIDNCRRRAQELLYGLSQFQSEQENPSDEVVWCETHQSSFTLHKTPTRVAEQFSAYMQSQPGAWIFTSATLSVAGNFSHFQQALGLESSQVHSWESPFDFTRQALLYIPEELPEPNTPQHLDAVACLARQVIGYSQGRAFILVTSYRALNQIAAQLKDIDYPLLVQGEQSRGELLHSFRRQGNAVLIGTSSFWEGVDVKGEALSCVIIDKLPFAAPDDPVLQARIDTLQQQGRNPFMEIQLPRAVIGLKQGVGRLIRDQSDTGALVICDPRMISKSYGRVFLDSLPAMTKTRKLERLERFFQYCKTRQTVAEQSENPQES